MLYGLLSGALVVALFTAYIPISFLGNYPGRIDENYVCTHCCTGICGHYHESKKILWSSPSLKIQSTPPPPPGALYCISLFKRHGVYYIFSVSDVAFIWGQRLFQNRIS